MDSPSTRNNVQVRTPSHASFPSSAPTRTLGHLGLETLSASDDENRNSSPQSSLRLTDTEQHELVRNHWSIVDANISNLLAEGTNNIAYNSEATGSNHVGEQISDESRAGQDDVSSSLDVRINVVPSQSEVLHSAVSGSGGPVQSTGPLPADASTELASEQVPNASKSYGNRSAVTFKREESHDNLELKLSRYHTASRSGTDVIQQAIAQGPSWDDADRQEIDGDEVEDFRRPSTEIGRTSIDASVRNGSSSHHAGAENLSRSHQATLVTAHGDVIVYESAEEAILYIVEQELVAREEHFWLDLCEMDVEISRKLSKILGWHPLTAEDCLANENGRDRWEAFGDNYATISLRARTAQDYRQDSLAASTSTVPLNVIVSKHWLCTVWGGPLTATKTCLRRLSSSGIQGLPGVDWIVYAILDAAVDELIPLVDAASQEVEILDELILSLDASESSDLLRRIAFSRKTVLELRRSLTPKKEMVQSICQRSASLSFIRPNVVVFLRDVLDELQNLQERLSWTWEMLNTMQSNYMAVLSVEAAKQANSMNSSMEKLSVVATIMLPLGVIASLWGMNVDVPGGANNNLAWFVGILVGMIVIVAVMYFYFKTRGWIRMS